MNIVGRIVLSVVVERLTRYALDQYVMPLFEYLPKRSKPFGFTR